MSKRLLSCSLALLCLLPFTAPAGAEFSIERAYARETPPGSSAGAAFMVLNNRAQESVTLLEIRSPVAHRAEIHQHTEAGGVMQMRRMSGGLEIPAGGQVVLQPGGYHVMLMGLKRRLQAGETLQMKLSFSDGSHQRLTVPVLAMEETLKGALHPGQHADHSKRSKAHDDHGDHRGHEKH
ncbi:copper chaperone PCu(A)C [Motiliproteus sp. SC1-56]|uniref:copper chaperone PCu(A)C n=1 Tax=Motiliproteus sp. SC1-56 TaxID=2799565 RepID=UPI001A90810B|nr:copper chaperone PCu(A)C [Motiliproteus sp. SC1-56]